MAKTIKVPTTKRALSLKPTGGDDAESDTPRTIPSAPTFATAAEKEPSYMAGGICAILAVVCLIVVVLLQYMELEYLKEPASGAVASAAP